MKDFEPKVMVFRCNWSLHAGTNPTSNPPRAKTKMIRTMCAGKVDPSFIIKAFATGIDGIMLTVCRPKDCHYLSGNYQAVRRLTLLQNTLQQLGIEPERLRVEWISTVEEPKFQSAVNEFVDKLAELGPVR